MLKRCRFVVGFQLFVDMFHSWLANKVNEYVCNQTEVSIAYVKLPLCLSLPYHHGEVNQR